ncbi:E3 ubiquitin-protein ligase UPL3 [Dichanthelium oligosanthes]|uniref:HECT-type E3 ubiquitin transferase n=1 Tax=Dichanthelium oligosanthes TaxID=888268 RepID=A0A1E5UQ61_9POAL|nr:E3 ubiquitin-protein ligase UPL3 [Dichanthelium oligosanthes]
METRSRKRAEASSSSATSSSRSSKRSRPNPNPNPPADTPPNTAPAPPRARRYAAVNPLPAMDSSGDNKPNPNPPPRRRGRPSNADKGKEQQQSESSESSRLREAERLLGLGFEGIEDDDDAGFGAGAIPPSLTSASTALQGLLRKLGAGLDDILPSSALSAAAAAASSSSASGQLGGRLKKILVGLRADGEDGRQVEALTQLCEMLSIGTEESLGAFSVDSFVPVLVGLLNHESNPDIMLLAARALTHLCDVLPSSCSAVVHYGAVACFCARLLTIEYMDLAEQSLQALKKISLEHPTACLRAGALMAVLSYLDFFSTGVQRVALSTAANMCRKLPSDASDFVMEAVPLLTNLLNYHDSKVLEHASVCLTRIVEAFSSSPEKLDELCNHGLIAQAASLVSVNNSAGQASLSTSTYTGVIRLLSICASGSPLAAKTLLLLGISGTLKDILSGSGLVAGTIVTPALTRPADQINEIVKLADELLPPLPVGTISLPMYSDVHIKGSSVKKSTSSKHGEPGSVENELSGREKLLHDQPELLQQFGMDLLPTMAQVYGSSISGPVRHKCLSVIGKLMYYSSAEMIQSLLSTTNISSFLAGILAWKDPQVLIPALQIAEVLMEKLPEIFLKLFVREGVVHAVELLICTEFSSLVTPQISQLDNHVDSITSSRSRRNRRRNNAVNTENNLPNEAKGLRSVIANSPPSTTEIPNNGLRALVNNRAKSFKDKYFPSEPGSSDIAVTDDLLKLRALCAKLNTTADTIKMKAKGKSMVAVGNSFDVLRNVEDQLDSIISEMLSELSKGDGVSTFEFIGSGVVTALLNYLSCGSFGREKVSEANRPNLLHQAVRRYKAFISVALPNYEDWNKTPMALLVQKLQNALSSSECFPVVLSHSGRAPTLGGSRLATGLVALSQPFKLRLCRAPGERSLKDYSSNIVLIDPLASLAAVEEFLWPRVLRTESVSKPIASSAKHSESGAASSTAGAPSIPSATQTGRRASLRSKSSAATSGAINNDHQKGSINASKGKGKAVLKLSLDEQKGPHTRNAARRKAASEKDVEPRPSDGHSTSEDEDRDASPVDIDDALLIDDDEDVSDDDHEAVLRGSLPACFPERVHDVKLGDADDSSVVGSLANNNHAQPPSVSSTKNTSSTGLNAAEFRSPSTFVSRDAMSFAAAAMAGLTSASSRGIRGSQDRSGLPFGARPTEHYNKLIFTAGGKQLNKHLTVYQALQRQVVHDEGVEDRLAGSDLPDDGNRFWGDVFTVTYQKADNAVGKGSVGGLASAPKFSKSDSCKQLSEKQCTSLLDSILQGELPCDLEKSNQTYNILSLLRVLEGLNQLSPRLRLQATSENFVEGKVATLDGLYDVGLRVPPEEFVNSKMTPKLARQTQDVLALCSGSLPSWCHQLTKACPFLFPFETRRQYFYSTAFGLSRALHRLQQQLGDNNNGAIEREVRVGRLQRQKVRVSRNRILDSAAKVMEMFSNQKAVLEVEYFGEVGTGLGPTLEFYTLLSHDLQRVDLGLWRSHSPDDSWMQIDGNGDHLTSKKHESESLVVSSRNIVQAPLGLFPQPWPPSAAESEGSKFFKVVEYFRLVGRVMAKALQDGRLLDLPLSTAFYKLLLGQELDLYDILSFDTEFGKILQELQTIVARKRFLESCSESQKIEELCFHGAPVEDLCLDFTLPGYPDYVLKEGGENTVVDIYNLEEYISLVVHATVKTGIMRQVEALKAGFNQVFDISSLQIFSPQELDYLICGRRELWEPEILLEHIKFDHGYTSKSLAIVNFLEIMAEFTPEQQHAFCQFVTGAPRLPPGGLAALNPKLTIVRKHSSSAAGTTESADDDLPSVMTCANYLKLPPYSSKAVMLRKLLYAINEGQGSFDLS